MNRLGQLLLPFHKSVARSEGARLRDSIRKSKWQKANKAKLNEKRRISRAKDGERVRLQTNKRNGKNRAALILRRREWAKHNKTTAAAYAAKHYKRFPYSHHKKHLTDKYFAYVLRSRLQAALAGKSKAKRTLALLGCSIELFKAHLQSKFYGGMEWNNHGKVWHIDHIKPCASFDLSDPAQQAICFHYSNMQPLLAIENLRKGCRV